MRSKSSRVTTVRRKSAYRPRIESLEDRLLMAVITVTSTGDAISATDGVVTLREAIPDPSAAPRLALHATELGFVHPITGAALHWDMPLPVDLHRLVERMRGSARS